jgi:hypothetical protein
MFVYDEHTIGGQQRQQLFADIQGKESKPIVK